MKEEKIRKIVSIIARRAMDPQRNVPHTPQRIERAIEEAKVRVDELESAEAQVERIVDALKPILPISMESLEIMVRVPPQYTGKAYGKISEFGKLKKDEWRNDGSWVATIEIPAGLQGEFYNLLNGLTKGEAETRLVKKG
jgi:ribosome maturation protein SDO1